MSRWVRWAPLSGIVFAALIIASFAVSGSTPGVKATGQHVISYYTDNRGSQLASAFLGLYAIVFFLFFAAALRGYLRRAEPESGSLAAMSLGGAILRLSPAAARSLAPVIPRRGGGVAIA